MTAVLQTATEVREAANVVVPIGELQEVDREEVTIEGVVRTLWEPSHPKIRQVGLIEDETGVTKFTSWERSGQTMVAEGERVRLVGVAKSEYQGRVSVALTGWSRVVFPDAGRWWVD